MILGVYSRRVDATIGEGMTLGEYESVTYWYVRQLAEETFEIQPLNTQHVPSGMLTRMEAVKFLRQFEPEPAYYERHTFPAMKTLAKKVRQGEKALAAGDLDESERQFAKALMIDELNVDANLGLGEVYVNKEDLPKLKSVLDRLMGIGQVFHDENRVKFNRFGISLRKHGHFDDAIRYYEQALSATDSDEHIYFNMARAYMDKGDLDQSMVQLQKALELAPDFVEAKKFLAYCRKRLEGDAAAPAQPQAPAKGADTPEPPAPAATGE